MVGGRLTCLPWFILNVWFLLVDVGVVYGNGVYFARDASYSHAYASADAQGYRRIYFTQVLCGEYTTGRNGMIIPPPKNPQVDQSTPFDSTVDNISNPDIFVVYNDSQHYPAYLITYF